MKVFTPQFDSRHPQGNHDQLCGVLLLPHKSAVPVSTVVIRSPVFENGEFTVNVGTGTHALALIAFYFMAMSGTNQFLVTDEMRYILSQICGAWYASDVIVHPELQAVRALRGPEETYVILELKDDYWDHLATERTSEELIRNAWERRNTLAADTPEPLLILALETSNEWMDDEWQNRAKTLKRLLKRH